MVGGTVPVSLKIRETMLFARACQYQCHGKLSNIGIVAELNSGRY
jgi:hypothetical protein